MFLSVTEDKVRFLGLNMTLIPTSPPFDVQAGLSWATILRKRKAYQEAYNGFDIEQVAGFSEENISRLLLPDSKIVRNKLKVRSAVINARYHP